MKIAAIFLFLVGLTYILNGLFAVTAGANPLSLILAETLTISPLQFVEEAVDSWRCGSGLGIEECFPGAFEKADQLAFILGIFSIIGGIAGTLGAVDIYRNKKSGYRIWQFLVAISIIVVLSNWTYVASTPRLWEKGNWMIAVFPTVWCLLYLLALFFVRKVGANSNYNRLKIKEA